jgi:hypothetical protein
MSQGNFNKYRVKENTDKPQVLADPILKFFNGGFLMPAKNGGMLAYPNNNNQSGYLPPRMKAGGWLNKYGGGGPTNDGGKKVKPVYVLLPDGRTIKSDTGEHSQYADYINKFGYTEQGHYEKDGTPVWYAPGYLDKDKPLDLKIKEEVKPMEEVVVTENPIITGARKKAKGQVGTWNDWGKTHQTSNLVQNSGLANPMQDLADQRKAYTGLLNTTTYQNVIDQYPRKEGEDRLAYIDRLNGMIPGFVDKAKGFGLTEPFDPGNATLMKQWAKKGTFHTIAGIGSTIFPAAASNFINSAKEEGNKPVSGLTSDEAKEVGIFQPFETLDNLAWNYGFKPGITALDNTVDPLGKNSRTIRQRYAGPSETDKVFTGLLNPLNYIGPGELLSGGRNLIKGTEGLKDVYNTVATGESILPIAWKSPAVGLSEEASQTMFKNILNNANLTDAERAIVADYQHNSRLFTGRNGNIDPVKRQAMNDIVKKYNINVGDDAIATRMFNPNNNSLGATLENGRLNFGDRPTSFTVGAKGSYGSGATDRIVIPNRYLKNMEGNFVKNTYEPLSEEALNLVPENLKDWAAGIGRDGSRLGQERELIGSGLDFKRIGKVKNDVGGHDWIVKPKTNNKFGSLSLNNKVDEGIVSGNYLKSEYTVPEDIKESMIKSTNTITGKGRELLNDVASPEGIKRLKNQFKLANPSLTEDQLSHLVATRLSEASDALQYNKPRFWLTHGQGAPGTLSQNIPIESLLPTNNAHFVGSNPWPHVGSVKAPESLFPRVTNNTKGLNLGKKSGTELFVDPDFNPGTITLGTNFEENPYTLSHEFGHALQGKGSMPIDQQLIDLWKGKKNPIETFLDRWHHRRLSPESKKDLKYFLNSDSRSVKSEPYAFLREQREKMLDRGILGETYDKITPFKMWQARRAAAGNTLGNFAEGDRIAKFLPWWKYNRFSKIANTAPAALPAIGGAGLLLNEDGTPQQAYGGPIGSIYGYRNYDNDILSNKAYGGGLLSRTVTCSNCGHSWKGVTGGLDPLTCHNCGGMFPEYHSWAPPRMDVGGSPCYDAQGNVIPCPETIYHHQKGTGGLNYDPVRTVSPYLTNNDIKKYTQSPASPSDVNFITNFAKFRKEFRNYGDDYNPTEVPYKGEKHWNINRFIIDPHLNVAMSDLNVDKSTPEERRASILADMYKYNMLQNPNHKGTAFRKAKRFVRNEVDPIMKGAFYNDFLVNSSGTPNFNMLDPINTFADENPLRSVHTWNEGITSNEDMKKLHSNYKPEEWNDDRIKNMSMDYLINYKKMSKKDAAKQWQTWTDEEISRKNTEEYLSKQPRIQRKKVASPKEWANLSDDDRFNREQDLPYEGEPKFNVEYYDPILKKTNTKQFNTNEQAEQFYNDPANKASSKYSDLIGHKYGGDISIPDLNTSNWLKKYKVGGPGPKKITIDLAAEKGKQFNTDWMNSPMYKQMLETSMGANKNPFTFDQNRIDADSINRGRQYQLKNSQWGVGEQDPRNPEGTFAETYSWKPWGVPLAGAPVNYIDENSKYPNAIPYVNFVKGKGGRPEDEVVSDAVHEFSHISDASGQLIPDSDKKLMTQYAAPSFLKSPLAMRWTRELGPSGTSIKNKKIGEDWINYIKIPTETRARLTDFRMRAKEQGLYDPFTQRFDSKYLKNYKPVTDTDPLLNLKDVYTDDEISDMLNKVSKSDNGQSQTTAKYGGASTGWLGKYETGSEVTDTTTIKPGWSLMSAVPEWHANGTTTIQKPVVKKVTETPKKLPQKSYVGKPATQEEWANSNSNVNTQVTATGAYRLPTDAEWENVQRKKGININTGRTIAPGWNLGGGDKIAVTQPSLTEAQKFQFENPYTTPNPTLDDSDPRTPDYWWSKAGWNPEKQQTPEGVAAFARLYPQFATADSDREWTTLPDGRSAWKKRVHPWQIPGTPQFKALTEINELEKEKNMLIGKTAIQLADPTGVSMWGDTWDSYKELYNNPSVWNATLAAVNTVASLPLVKYFGEEAMIPVKGAETATKVANITSKLEKLYTKYPELSKLQKAMNVGEKVVGAGKKSLNYLNNSAAGKLVHYVGGEPFMKYFDKATGAEKLFKLPTTGAIQGFNKMERFGKASINLPINIYANNKNIKDLEKEKNANLFYIFQRSDGTKFQINKEIQDKQLPGSIPFNAVDAEKSVVENATKSDGKKVNVLFNDKILKEEAIYIPAMYNTSEKTQQKLKKLPNKK